MLLLLIWGRTVAECSRRVASTEGARKVLGWIWRLVNPPSEALYRIAGWRRLKIIQVRCWAMLWDL